MKKANRTYSLIIVLMLITINFSCRKLVQVDPPTSRVSSSTVFESDATATSAISGIYSGMIITGFGSGNRASVSNLLGLSSDELKNYNSDLNQIQFYQNGLTSTNAYILSNMWSEPYQYIYAANLIIEGLDKSSGVSPSVKKQLMGEAKFIRALCHFYLVNMFGPVPLALTSDYKVNAILHRSSEDDVYNQIISDLKDGQSLMSNDYSMFGNERVRPNKWAAIALLARVYLYKEDWKNAEAYASQLIANSTDYSLITDLNKVFLANSKEAIWQLKPVGTTSDTGEASNFYISGTPGNVSISEQLLNAFEPGDNRRSQWIGSYTSNSVTYYFPYKYKITTASLSEYSMVLRVGEQYLIRAEARLKLGDISNALVDLNTIRHRAGLSDIIPNSQTGVLSAILHERQVELFTEWGHRWFDLKRSGNLDAVMQPLMNIKGGVWNSNWALYPIPIAQINNDPNMAGSQNPGY